MALNPPITAIPLTHTDRNEHIQRFLTSLPKSTTPGLPELTPLTDDNVLVLHTDVSNQHTTWDRHVGQVANDPHDQEEKVETEGGHDLEVERRRYERKMRRREQAAIVKPEKRTNGTTKTVEDVGHETDGQLSDSWWDEHRRLKRGEIGPAPSTHAGRTRESPIVGRRSRTADAGTGADADVVAEGTAGKTGRGGRKGKGKGKGKGKREKQLGLPVLDIVMNYKPEIPITTSRLTLRPTSNAGGSKGLFANGKSSDPNLLRDLTGRHQSTSAASRQGPTRAARPPNSASEGAGVDWRDDWRAGPRAQAPPRSPSLGEDLGQVFPHLPPPGNTQSTSWSSRQRAEESSSRHSQATRQPPPERPVRDARHDWKGRHSYRPISNSHVPQSPPPLPTDHRGGRLDDDDLYLYNDPSSSRHGHWANSRNPFAHEQPPPRGGNDVYPFPCTGLRPVTHAHEPILDRETSLSTAGSPALQSEPHHQQSRFYNGGRVQHDSHQRLDGREHREPRITGQDPIPLDLEDEMQDFWKRHDRPRALTPFPPRQDHFISPHRETPLDVRAPPPGLLESYMSDSHMGPLFGHQQSQHPYRPGPHQSPAPGPSFPPRPSLTPRPAIPIPTYPSSSLPPSSSIIEPYRPSPSMPTVHEHEREAAEQAMEMGQYGTTTDEWKHLWSSRKAYR